jgi:ABC-2 type transport system ATP-binding protein
MTDIAISTSGLTRDFGRNRAVDDLSLEVPAGTIFGFLGPNGSGKTTTIRLLLGLLEPTAGSARVLGFDVATEPDRVRAGCGSLLEQHGIYDRLTVAGNLEFHGRIWGLTESERSARTEELLRHFNLWDERGQLAHSLSRGMKQKLAIARALLGRPPLVFLDEPTAGLDPIAAAALREDLAVLGAGEGVTIFLTTHNLVEAEKLCSQVAVIRSGRMLAVGSPGELRDRQGAPRVEIIGGGFSDEILAGLRARPEVAAVTVEDGRLLIDLTGDSEVAPLVGLIVNGGGSVEQAAKDTASLEEVFLALVEEDSE